MKVLWQQISSPTITEILCNSKFDGVVFDLEHGCFDNEKLYASIQVCSLSNKKSFIRVTDLDKPVIRMALDAGCSGVIMSTVETFDQAEEFYHYCVYPTNGKRGQGLVRENHWGKKGFDLRRPILIPQIETSRGVGNIKRLSQLNFDYFLVGPYDLSASLGCLGEFDSSIYKEAIDVLKTAVGEKLGYHIVKDIENQYEDLKECGFLAFGMDTLFMIDAIDSLEKLV